MTISINTRSLNNHTTGVQRYLQEIVGRLPEDGVRVISPAKCSAGEIGHLWEQMILPFLVKKDLLWSPSNNGPLAVCRQVLTLHDVVPLENPEWVNRKLGAWLKFLLPRLTHNVQRIITVSEFSKGRIVELLDVPDEKIVVIPNGVHQRFKAFAAGDRDKLVAHYPRIPEKYVLSVSSIEPRKNLGRLIKAWKSIVKDTPEDCFLLVAGKIGLEKIFGAMKLPQLPERVIELGYVPDELLATLYANAIGFAYISEYEGFGPPPLEAMASGVVPLTSNSTSLPEVVGDAGILVDPLNEEAIADGLRRLISDGPEVQQLRLKTVAQAAKFSWETAAARTWEVLQHESDT